MFEMHEREISCHVVLHFIIPLYRYIPLVCQFLVKINGQVELDMCVIVNFIPILVRREMISYAVYIG
jgi:hypothetical protein